MTIVWRLKRGLRDPPICSQLDRSTGNNLGLWLAFKMAGWGQSCRTKHLTCGTLCYLWVDFIKTKLNCCTYSWCLRIIRCGEVSTHTHIGIGRKNPKDSLFCNYFWPKKWQKCCKKYNKFPINLSIDY